MKSEVCTMKCTVTPGLSYSSLRTSIVNDLLFHVPPIVVFRGSVLVFVFGMHYVVTFIVLQSY